MDFNEHYLSCGILSKWHNKTFADFTNDDRAKKIVLDYLENPRQALTDGVGLYLFGNNGTGKSLLMNLAFKELLKKRYKVQVTNLDGLVHSFTQGWYDGDARKSLNSLLTRTDFLGIDDLCKEFHSKNSDLVVTVLDHVIRFRTQMGKPTWITSNKKPKLISTIYTEDIASMLREVCVDVFVDGEDFRGVIAEKNRDKYKK
jgi:DNA replication protein DnaC